MTQVQGFATDTGAAVQYTLSGDDAALFTLDAVTGELRFASAPDHEAAADSDGDNVYAVTVTASAGPYSSRLSPPVPSAPSPGGAGSS